MILPFPFLAFHTPLKQCDICSKKFSSSNAYQNHLNSKKHKEAAAQPVVPKQTSSSSQRSQQQQQQQKESEKEEKGEQGEGMEVDAASASTAPKAQSTATAPAAAKKKQPAGKKGGNADANAEAVDGDNEDEGEGEGDDDDEDIEEVDEFDSPLGLEDCIFCTEGFDTFEANLKHMMSAHSFFVPDMEYLMDLEGLIAYLQEKAAVYFECLKCNGKGRAFQSLEAVRKHMVDKGHCMIDYSEEGALELSEYYDFSSSYPDHEEVGEGWVFGLR